MEPYIQIAYLNDFIFCPMSIYFHQLFGTLKTRLYHDTPQISGKAIHGAVDEQRYSDKKDIIQGLEVYSEEFRLCGKIDILDTSKGVLTERKKYIETIYDGYLFQLYGQYFALKEMNYTINEICFYSYDNNKVHKMLLPEDNQEMYKSFCLLIENINNFNPESFLPSNIEKCQNCIYEPLCDRSLLC